MYSVFQVTGMIEGFLGVWNFNYQIFCSRKFGEYFFRWLYLSRDFWGIQNNPKICACGSAHISWLCSSSNKVQLTLLRLGNLVWIFWIFFLSYSIHQRSKFFKINFHHLILEWLQNTQPTRSLTWKTTPAVAEDFMFCYAEYLKLSE